MIVEEVEEVVIVVEVEVAVMVVVEVTMATGDCPWAVAWEDA